MASLITPLRMLVRFLGLAMIILGGVIWKGDSSIVTVHVQVGFALMLALILLIGVAATRKVAPTLLLAGMIPVILMPVVGFAQRTLLPGSSHWMIQVIHLLIGLWAIGMGESIGKRAKLGAA